MENLHDLPDFRPSFWSLGENQRRVILFARTGRNCVVVAGIRSHRIMDVWMRGEESGKSSVFFRIRRVVDQLRFLSEIARDFRMLSRKVIPGLELGAIETARAGGFEYGGGVAVDDSAERLVPLRQRGSGEGDRNCDCNDQSRLAFHLLFQLLLSAVHFGYRELS